MELLLCKVKTLHSTYGQKYFAMSSNTYFQTLSIHLFPYIVCVVFMNGYFRVQRSELRVFFKQESGP